MTENGVDSASAAELSASSQGEVRQARLIAVIVGIDRYRDGSIPDLVCAVNDAGSVCNAIRQTQPADALHLFLLTAPARDADAVRPDRDGILAVARQAAELAGAGDTILVYFAGHGGIVKGKPCLFPTDTVRSSTGISPAIAVEELQQAFEGSPAMSRVLFLDCCQNVAGKGVLPSPEAMIKGVQQHSTGWAVLFSCSSGEYSIEDPKWGEHGVFSHFLAAGLSGQADMGGDGVVSLGELVDYLGTIVPKQAEAILDEMRREKKKVPNQTGQNPVVIWNGPMNIPLTQWVVRGRVGFSWDVLRLWVRFLHKPLPYILHVEGMIRYGTAFLYGLAIALMVLRFAWPWADAGPWPGIACGVGFISALVWIGTFALIGAAKETHWHNGGYWTSLTAFGWQVAVLAGMVLLKRWIEPTAEAFVPSFWLAMDLFLLIALMVIFAYNAIQTIVALTDLVNRNERLVLRKAFVHLDKQWFHADLPNVIAFVSGHAKVYQAICWTFFALAAAHAGYVLFRAPLTVENVLLVCRDLVLLVFVQWQAQWYAASYRKLRGMLLPEK